MPPTADAVGQRFVGMKSGLIVVGYWDDASESDAAPRSRGN
jgi:hypothetical protein